MRVFIAGGTGAIGRSLVPMLVKQGHAVVAMTRSEGRRPLLQSIGATAVIGDVFDPAALSSLVKDAKPDIVIHQLTAFGAKDADPLAETVRVRIEGTRNLVAAARAAKAKRFIAQCISFMCTPKGSGLTDESTPLYLDAPDGIRPMVDAVASLEQQVVGAEGMEGIVLRYGWFYGPGTNYDPADVIPRGVSKGRIPIVGEGAGVYSFIHVDDAAAATVIALTRGARGVYNIVDDDPVPQREMLPFLANLLNAPPPPTLDVATACAKMGDMMVYIMNEQRGASNAKAKRELGWKPRLPSWRDGFRQIFSS